VTVDDIAGLLVRLGCPAEKSALLAAQLHKRAEQLAAQKGRTYEEALKHLLTIARDSGGFPRD
jgi:hypothetical protein